MGAKTVRACHHGFQTLLGAVGQSVNPVYPAARFIL